MPRAFGTGAFLLCLAERESRPLYLIILFPTVMYRIQVALELASKNFEDIMSSAIPVYGHRRTVQYSSLQSLTCSSTGFA